MRGACLLSHRNEDVSIFFGRASIHCETYWITGSIKNCQRMFVEQFGGKQAPSLSPRDWLTTRAVSSWLSLSYLIFSCYQLPFCEFPKHTTALHYRYDMQMYCTFVLFVNLHFPGLPASGEHCSFWLRIQGNKTILRIVNVHIVWLCTSLIWNAFSVCFR
jgi:hypothetical protein